MEKLGSLISPLPPAVRPPSRPDRTGICGSPKVREMGDSLLMMPNTTMVGLMVVAEDGANA